MIARMPPRTPPGRALAGQLELPFGPPSSDPDLYRLQLGNRFVEYRLKRGRRRTMAVQVDHRGVRVGAPAGMPIADIERFLCKHAGWLAEKLDEWGAGDHKQPMVIASGARIPYLGELLTLHLCYGPWSVRWGNDGIHLSIPPRHQPVDALRMALAERALELFGDRTRQLAATLGLTVPPLRLSDAQGRWGSCSRASGIRLNWRLIHLPLAIVDYVVTHELAHLVEMNHSPRFWAVVARACPEYRTRRRQLAEMARSLPRF